jgi:glyoxylase-like metal-dependent hydrolase (beta-lactamase superfamily II)
LWDGTGECAIVDAGCYNVQEFEKLDGFIKSKNLKPVKLINTHCHFDHIMGVGKCREAYSLKWEAHSAEAFWVENAQKQGAMFGIPMQPVSLPEIELNDGDNVSFGNTTLKVIHVPGHSPGSVCFYIEATKTLLAGDVLFKGSIGRTDLPGGDFDTLISGIKTKLLVLPGDVKVYPGHGPATTIGEEKEGNPFLL